MMLGTKSSDHHKRSQQLRTFKLSIALLVLSAAVVPCAWAEVAVLATLDGESHGDFFGQSVSGGGDYNGDGNLDFIVGAYAADSYDGALYIFQGPITGGYSYTHKISNSESGIRFGVSSDFAGNFLPGDGDCLVVGQSLFSAAAAWVYRRSSGNNVLTELEFPTCAANMPHYGGAVKGGGDFNGDGYDDIIVGHHNNSSIDYGLVGVYFGQSTAVATMTPSILFQGETGGDHFGRSIDFLPDINGDGKDEILVLASNFKSSGQLVGKAYVLFGRAEPSSPDVSRLGSSCWSCTGYSCSSISADVTITGDTSDPLRYVAAAGDNNGDGTWDVAVASDSGKSIFVHWLSSSVSGNLDASDADIEITGLSLGNAAAATPLATAGDINADGIDDLLLGAYQSNSTEGRVRVLLGCKAASPIGSISFASLDLTLTPPGNVSDWDDDQFGSSVASVGDIDQDGLDDVLIGAPYGGPTGYDNNDPGSVALYRNPTIFYENESAASDLTYSGTPYSSIDLPYGAFRGLLISRAGTDRPVLFRRTNLVGGVPEFSASNNLHITGSLGAGARGLASADMDNDGGPEFFLARSAGAELWSWDSSTSKFIDKTSLIPSPGGTSVAEDSWAGAWGDFDRDGWVDLAIARASGGDTPSTITAEDAILLRNQQGEGGSGFADATSAAGLSSSNTASVSIGWTDLDLDGNPDLFIGSLSDSEDSKLFENDGDGTFTDKSSMVSGLKYVSSVAFADLDADGDDELILGRRDTSNSNLMICSNNYPTSFPELTYTLGLDDGMPLTAAYPLDADLSGTFDILSCPVESNDSPKLMRNPSPLGDKAFADMLGDTEIGVGSISGMVASDFNDDGDLDLYLGRVAPTISQGNKLYMHSRPGLSGDDPSANWIGANLFGGDGNNRAAIGARVELLVDDQPVIQQVVDGGSLRGGQLTPLLRFGLGSSCEPVKLRVTWPDGFQTTSAEVSASATERVVDLYDTHGLSFVGSTTVSKTLKPGGKVDWTIQWTTDYSAPTTRDVVEVVESGTNVFPVSSLTYAQSFTDVSVKRTSNGYLHTVVVSDIDCEAGTYTFKPSSSVLVWDATSGTTTVKSTPSSSGTASNIHLCIQ